jgi:hypothetical protein
MKAAGSGAALALAIVTLVTPARLAAQTTTPIPVPTSPTTPGAGVTPDTGLQIVEVTQAVAAGAAGTAAFTPPAGSMLVVTDMLVTNPNTTAVCGIDVARAGTPLTGGLCVAPQTTLQFAFTTAVEFSDTTPVQLVNASTGTEPVRVHLRGFLMPTPTATPPTTTPPPTTTTPRS